MRWEKNLKENVFLHMNDSCGSFKLEAIQSAVDKHRQVQGSFL